MRKKLITVITIIVCMLFPGTVFADYSENPVMQSDDIEITTTAVPVKSKAVVLMDGINGNVLYKQNEREKRSPASITKVMTLLLVMEAVDSGRIKLNEVVSCSDHAASMGGSQVWLEPGERMTVDDLIKATAVNSANDAAVALAEFVAGSEESFVEMMNKRAKELGMNDTTFKNACGLDADGHVTSALDIAIMAKELIAHQLVMDYSKIWTDTLRNGKTELANTNKLIKTYDGATGLKTGYTEAAGYCLAATALRGGLPLIAITLGSDTIEDRNETAKALLDYGYANYTVYTPSADSNSLKNIQVLKGVKNQVSLTAEKPSALVVPKGTEKTIKQKLELPENLMAPVDKGQTVGKLTFVSDAKVLCEYKILAAEDIQKMSFLPALSILFQEFFKV